MSGRLTPAEEAVAHALLDDLVPSCSLGREEQSVTGPCPRPGEYIIEWGCQEHGGMRKIVVCAVHRTLISSWCDYAAKHHGHPLVITFEEPLGIP